MAVKPEMINLVAFNYSLVYRNPCKKQVFEICYYRWSLYNADW